MSGDSKNPIPDCHHLFPHWEENSLSGAEMKGRGQGSDDMCGHEQEKISGVAGHRGFCVNFPSSYPD